MGIPKAEVKISYKNRHVTVRGVKLDTNSTVNVFPLKVAKRLKIPFTELELKGAIEGASRERISTTRSFLAKITIGDAEIEDAEIRFWRYPKSIIGAFTLQDAGIITGEAEGSRLGARVRRLWVGVRT